MLTMRSFVSNLQIKENNKLTGPIPTKVNEICDKDSVCELEADDGGTNNFNKAPKSTKSPKARKSPKTSNFDTR